MKKSATLEQLASCLIQVIGRYAIPPDRVREVVGDGKSNVRAFNMCDGMHTQREIAKKLRIDQGQLSRTFARWVEGGIAFPVGDGNEARLLHIYPVRGAGRAKKRAKKARKVSRASRR